jgi:hypothetical protein
MEEQYIEQEVPIDLHVSSPRCASRCQYHDDHLLYQEDFDCTTSEQLF